MRVLFSLVLAAAASDVACDERDELSALQTQSLQTRTGKLVAEKLQQRAEGSAVLAAFDASMAAKDKTHECSAEQVQEMTSCMTLGGNSSQHYHLSDVFGNSSTASAAIGEILNSNCEDMTQDLWCLRSSECFERTFSTFKFQVAVTNASEPVYPSQVCADMANSTDLQFACGMTPESMCKHIANSTSACGVLECSQTTSDVDLEKPMTVDYCDHNEDAVEETDYDDFMIHTKEGCKAAVESMGIPFHMSLKKWMRTKRKPLGCYVFEKRKGPKGYFNKFGRKQERATDFSVSKRRSVCKKFT